MQGKTVPGIQRKNLKEADYSLVQSLGQTTREAEVAISWEIREFWVKLVIKAVWKVRKH